MAVSDTSTKVGGIPVADFRQTSATNDQRLGALSLVRAAARTATHLATSYDTNT